MGEKHGIHFDGFFKAKLVASDVTNDQDGEERGKEGLYLVP